MVGQVNITLTFFPLLCAQHLELQQPHLVLELGERILKNLFFYLIGFSYHMDLHVVNEHDWGLSDFWKHRKYNRHGVLHCQPRYVTLHFEQSKMPVAAIKRSATQFFKASLFKTCGQHPFEGHTAKFQFPLLGSNFLSCSPRYGWARTCYSYLLCPSLYATSCAATTKTLNAILRCSPAVGLGLWTKSIIGEESSNCLTRSSHAWRWFTS